MLCAVAAVCFMLLHAVCGRYMLYTAAAAACNAVPCFMFRHATPCFMLFLCFRMLDAYAATCFIFAIVKSMQATIDEQ